MAEERDDVGVVFRLWLVVASPLHFAKLAVSIEDEGRNRIPSDDVSPIDFAAQAQNPVSRPLGWHVSTMAHRLGLYRAPSSRQQPPRIPIRELDQDFVLVLRGDEGLFLLHLLPPRRFVLRERVEQLTWTLSFENLVLDFRDRQAQEVLKPLLQCWRRHDIARPMRGRKAAVVLLDRYGTPGGCHRAAGTRSANLQCTRR